MNITITGNLGAGKSSVCKIMKKKGCEVISAGSIFRQIAEEKGIDVTELNKLAEQDRSIDDMIDERSAKLGAEKDGAVFDSRMAWHFVPQSFKVFLLTDPMVSAKRVMRDETRHAEQYASLQESLAALKRRANLEQERFRELYGVDYYDVSNYDFVIETSCATPEQVASEIVRNAAEYTKQPFASTRFELNPLSLYPTREFSALSAETLNRYLDAEARAGRLCGQETVRITEKDGSLYLIDGHCRTFASAAAGDPFVACSFDLSDAARETVRPLTKEFLQDYERIGHFRYRAYPSENGVEQGYMANFANAPEKKPEV